MENRDRSEVIVCEGHIETSREKSVKNSRRKNS